MEFMGFAMEHFSFNLPEVLHIAYFFIYLRFFFK